MWTESPALERAVTDLLQLRLDRASAIEAHALLAGQGAQRGEICIIESAQILLLEQVELHLAAGGLRNAAHRHHGSDLEPGVHRNAARHLLRNLQENHTNDTVQTER